MKCTACDGRGFFPVSNIAAKICPQCGGTGEIEMTEQEYLQTCNTEQLAEWIVHLADECTMQHECGLCNSWCDEKRVVEWLKQPHKGVTNAQTIQTKN